MSICDPRIGFWDRQIVRKSSVKTKILSQDDKQHYTLEEYFGIVIPEVKAISGVYYDLIVYDTGTKDWVISCKRPFPLMITLKDNKNYFLHCPRLSWKYYYSTARYLSQIMDVNDMTECKNKISEWSFSRRRLEDEQATDTGRMDRDTKEVSR